MSLEKRAQSELQVTAMNCVFVNTASRRRTVQFVNCISDTQALDHTKEDLRLARVSFWILCLESCTLNHNGQVPCFEAFWLLCIY